MDHLRQWPMCPGRWKIIITIPIYGRKNNNTRIYGVGPFFFCVFSRLDIVLVFRTMPNKTLMSCPIYRTRSARAFSSPLISLFRCYVNVIVYEYIQLNTYTRYENKSIKLNMNVCVYLLSLLNVGQRCCSGEEEEREKEKRNNSSPNWPSLAINRNW